MDNDKNYEIEVLQRLSRIETLLEDFKNVETKANDAYIMAVNNKKDIDEIKDNNKWLFRTAMGALIVTFINTALSILTNFPGK